MNKKKITLILALSAILVISVLPAAALDSNWHQFQKDEINIGITDSPAPIEDAELAWSAFTYGSEVSNGIDVTPIIAGDMVYIYAANGSIWAFDKTSGDLIWKNETTGGNLQTSVPAYGDGKIFVAAESGDLFAFNATTGEKLWNVHVTDGNFECPITYVDHKIYIAEGLKGGVTTKYHYCYDDNGTQLWNHSTDDTGGFLWCGASVVADYLVYATHEGKLISLYKENGTLADEVDLTSDLSFSRSDLGKVRASVTYHDGYIYTTSEKGQPLGYVFKVGFDNGTFVDDGWSTANGFSTSTPVVYDGKVYVGQGEHGFTGNLTCLNDSTGEIIWSYFIDAGVKSSPAISIQDGKPYIYFTGAKMDGSLYCLNSNGTLAWEYNPPDKGYILQGAAISDGFVYFGTDAGYIYCLKEKPPSTIYVPDDCPTIQEAVNNASIGNTIIARDGTYIENVDVGKSLTIKSENGTDSTVVQAANPNDHVFYISAGYVNMSGFTVEGAKEGFITSGLYLDNAEHCNIYNNEISDNRRGIFLDWHSSYNVIANNTIDNISTGITFETSSNNIATNNTVLKIVGSGGMRDCGIYLVWSSGNIITNNNVNTSGISVNMANDNKIYLNNLYAKSSDATNIWNSTAKVTYSYEGKTCTNYTGNYWGSDYTGSDANGDGIGDTPYSISHPSYDHKYPGEDNYPLVKPFENYQIITQTDLVPMSLPTTLYLQTNVITATISNMGIVDAGEFNISLSANGTVVDKVGVSGVTAGSSTTVSLTWTPSKLGYFELCVLADCDDEVVETNETNNKYCENVTVEEPEPDLTISKVILKTPGYVGRENILGVTVENIGAKNAGSFNLTLEVNGTQLGAATVTSLDAWMRIELEFAWTPTDTGGHELTATADSKDEIEESDETNNNLTRTSVIIKRTDWTQFHYGDTHVGFSPSTAPNTNETLWISEDIGARGSTSPVVAEGKVFVNCGGVVKALDEYTGEYLSDYGSGSSRYGSWASPCYHNGKVWCGMSGSVNGGTMVADGKVFAGNWDGCHYYCWDEETGEELWNFTVSGYAQGTAAYTDGKVYFTSWPYGSGGYVYCVDSNTGAEIWSTHTTFEACGSPAISNGIVFVTNYNFYGDGEIYALNATNGSILWNQTIQRTSSTPAVAYGNVYICGGCAGFSDVQTYCFNATTGELIWETNVSDGIGGWTCSVAVADGKVFVGKPGAGGMFFGYAGTYALDAFTGDIIWSYPEGGSSPAVADGMVFTIGEGKVYAFGEAGVNSSGNITQWNNITKDASDNFSVDIHIEENKELEFGISSSKSYNWTWSVNGEEIKESEGKNSNLSFVFEDYGIYNVSVVGAGGNETECGYWNVTVSLVIGEENDIRELDGLEDHTLRISKKPERIVSMAPSCTEILFAVGAGDRVVGVTEYCNYPPEVMDKVTSGEIEVIGGYSTPSFEKIVNLTPDLIVSAYGNPDDVLYQLIEQGYHVYAQNPKNIEAVFSHMKTTAAITKCGDNATLSLNALEERMERVTQQVGTLEEEQRPGVFYTCGDFWTPGNSTFINDVVHAAGGKNIAADYGSGYFQISPDNLTEKNPQVIICPSESAREQILNDEQLSSLNAVIHRRIHVINGDTICRPGPRIVDATETVHGYLSALLEPAKTYPMLQYDAQRTGNVSGTAPETATLLWQSSEKTAGCIQAGPIVYDGKVYLTTWWSSGMGVGGNGVDALYCLDANTGEEIWSNTAVYGASTAAIADEKLFVGTHRGDLACVNVTNGALLWSKKIEDNPSWYGVGSSPLVFDDRVYVLTFSDGTLHTFSFDGTELWNFSTGGEIFCYASPSAYSNKIFFAGNDLDSGQHALYCLDLSTRAEVWNFTTETEIRGSPTIWDEEGMIFFTTKYVYGKARKLYAVNITTGAEVWNVTHYASWASPALSNRKIYIGGSGVGTTFYCYNAENGSLIWKNTAMGGAIDSSPVVADGKVYFGVNKVDGTVYALDANNGSILWSYTLHIPDGFGGGYNVASPPAVADRTLFIGVDNAGVLAFRVEETPSPCFIATAAYGTPLHEDIDVLRDFRDEYLMTNPIGKAFVKAYYTTSPSIADALRENERLRTVVREGLVEPLVYISRMLVEVS